LRELAGEQLSTAILSPDPDFVYRPMTVREPFAYGTARRYPLEEIARDIGAELIRDAFKWLDADQRVVHTAGGQTVTYDALLLAIGAIKRPRFRHALTLDDARLDEQMHGLIQDVEGGYVRKLAFVIPDRMPWLLPIYELALMTARRAFDMGMEVSISLATPEDAPLAIFGQTVSEAVSGLLTENGIAMIPSAHCEMPTADEVVIHPGPRRLPVDRVVALPELFGPPTPGVRKAAPEGFIPVDTHCQVRGMDGVYAAGDAVDFPVKHGGVASQQADAAAQAIAASAGAAVKPEPFHPVIHGMLLGGKQPLYLSAHVTGGHGSSSQISDTPTWSPPRKIVAKHLAPYLEERDRVAGRAV
jgi:sulfide:quinone oxidoreductase